MKEHDPRESVDEPSIYDPPRYGFKIIDWGLFFAMLPFALVGSIPYNGEYREQGLDIPDCDSLMVFILATPALAVYFPGF